MDSFSSALPPPPLPDSLGRSMAVDMNQPSHCLLSSSMAADYRSRSWEKPFIVCFGEEVAADTNQPFIVERNSATTSAVGPAETSAIEPEALLSSGVLEKGVGPGIGNVFGSSPMGVREMAARTASSVLRPRQMCLASKTGSVSSFSLSPACSKTLFPGSLRPSSVHRSPRWWSLKPSWLRTFERHDLLDLEDFFLLSPLGSPGGLFPRHSELAGFCPKIVGAWLRAGSRRNTPTSGQRWVASELDSVRKEWKAPGMYITATSSSERREGPEINNGKELSLVNNNVSMDIPDVVVFESKRKRTDMGSTSADMN
nr:uncharacterized protein LOC109160752 [Ipomoea batatas]